MAGAGGLDATVAICTRNRARALRRLLASLAGMHVEPGREWEVVVADNASTDDTTAAARAFAGTLPLKLTGVATPGLSHARNACLDAARGRLVIFVDDDATVGPRWLETYLDAMRRYPEAAYFGSDIEPVFEGEGNPWKDLLLELAPNAYAAFEVGPADVPQDAASRTLKPPFGANIAFVADRLAGRRFDAGLGRRPGRAVLSGEETQLVFDLLEAGGHGVLVAGNPVRHWIEPARQTPHFVSRYFEGLGRLSGEPATRAPGGREPLRYWRRKAERALFPLWAPFMPRRQALERMIEIGAYIGACDRIGAGDPPMRRPTRGEP
ncbi:MAG: glycosyltransferase family 2 protein [Flavobacteriaceae bacterium]